MNDEFDSEVVMFDDMFLECLIMSSKMIKNQFKMSCGLSEWRGGRTKSFLHVIV